MLAPDKLAHGEPPMFMCVARASSTEKLGAIPTVALGGDGVLIAAIALGGTEATSRRTRRALLLCRALDESDGRGGRRARARDARRDPPTLAVNLDNSYRLKKRARTFPDHHNHGPLFLSIRMAL